MRKRCLIVIWILAVLTGLLSGCGETPPLQEEAPPAVPELVTGTGGDWESVPGQSLPEGFALPDPNVDHGIDFGEEPTAAPLPDVTYREDFPTDPVPTFIDSPEDLPEVTDEDIRPYVPTDPVISAETTDPPETDPTEPVPDASLLESMLEGELAELEGVWSVYVKNVDTGETVCIHDEPMTAASLIKLFVAGAYYVTDPQAKDKNRCGQADVMISVSSNDACNNLIDYLGKQTINAFIRLSGFTVTVLNRKMLEQSRLENFTSARECGLVLESILAGQYVSKAASARLLENLKQQQRTSKIPAGVPEGVETANKTGELSNVENDACIVWSEGGTYILCIMSEELTDIYAAREEIVKLSALVYEYFNRQTDPSADPGR